MGKKKTKFLIIIKMSTFSSMLNSKGVWFRIFGIGIQVSWRGWIPFEVKMGYRKCLKLGNLRISYLPKIEKGIEIKSVRDDEIPQS